METAPSLIGMDTLFETTKRAFQLSACGACHCLWIDPPPSKAEIASFYPTRYWWKRGKGLLKRLERLYRRAALRDHVAFIKRAGRRLGETSRPLRLLDVGCGSGTLLAVMKRRGFEVVGVDASMEAARIAETENGVRVVVGSLAEARFADASFDLVSLFHVLEHVTNPRDVLMEAQRVLQAGGRIVLQVPNIECWQFRIFGSRWYGLDVPRHVVDYSKRSLRRLLDECGFEVARIRDFNLRDNAPALASSIAPGLDPVSRVIRQRKRGIDETTAIEWFRHFLYLVLVVLAYPFVILESAAGHGATIMVEAVKK